MFHPLSLEHQFDPIRSQSNGPSVSRFGIFLTNWEREKFDFVKERKPSNEESEIISCQFLVTFLREEMLFNAIFQSFARPCKSLSYFDCFQQFLAMDEG